MKKGVLLSVVLFTCMVLCLSFSSTSNAAKNQTYQGFLTFGNWDPSPDECASGFGTPADNINIMVIITNNGDEKLTNLRLKFYDGFGNNVTKDGAYYPYMSELPAHATTNIMPINQIVRNHSNTQYCSIEFSWESTGNIRPQILAQAVIKDINGNFLDFITFTVQQP